MIVVHRIAHKAFVGDLEGYGARKYGGRWNPPGIPCLYCSEHLSLAVLEKFAHAQGKTEMANLATIGLKIPASAKLYKIDIQKLQPNWTQDIAYSQWLGKQILEDPDYAGFIVPSIIIPQEMNIVLNPASRHFKKIVPLPVVDFTLDSRLFAQLQ